MRKLAASLIGIAFLSSASAGVKETWRFLDNGIIRIGVNESAGAAVGWFSESGRDLNLLNHFDYGRYLQQSWYGESDGSSWNGKPWIWNPVQAGSWKGIPARVLDFECRGNRIFARSIPRHWAGGNEIRKMFFEESITLSGHLAKIHFTAAYRGTVTHPIHDQELPAVFVNPDFSNLCFIKAGESAPQSIRPGWPNERHQIAGGWVAYLDERGRGLGIDVPGTKMITCYRAPGDKNNRAKGACSYVAPVSQMEIKPGFHYEYDVYLTIGTLPEIRHRFLEIRTQSRGED